jgi:hypothetical protein
MAKPAITKYSVKGSPLTTSELDTNFQNLTDATVTLTAGSGGTAVTSDLNGTITLVAGSNITLTGNNTAKTITIASAGGGDLTSSDVVYLGQNDNDTFQFITNDPDKSFQISTNYSGSASSTLALGTTYGTNTVTSLNHGPSVGNLTLSSSTSVSITSAANNNITISPGANGKLSVSKEIATTVGAGTAVIDATSNAASYANAATVDFANFSGMVIVNRQDGGSGNVALWILGSGGAVKLGDSIGDQSGTFASNSGINGYRWTNNTGGTVTVAFAAIKTRSGA